MRIFVLPQCLCLLILLTGCFFNSAPNRAYPKDVRSRLAPLPQAQPAARASLDLKSPVTGFWQGVSSADCLVDAGEEAGRCHAVQKITLTMVQQGDSITGLYRCAYGDQVCRNLNTEGAIRDGRMIGRRLQIRVMLGDGSMCFFTAIPQGGVMDGRYSCLQGGGLVERGAFRTVRVY